MQSRRKFLIQTGISGIVGGLLGPGRSQALPRTAGDPVSPSAQAMTASAAKSLRVLILGATGFIGPHFVRAAVERGHVVSIFSRGRAHADLPSGVERLIGDRNDNLEALKNREWDVVFDLAAYIPLWVRTLGQVLAGRTKHYTFISTEAVYRYPGAVDESSAVQEYTGTVDAYSASPEQQYGPLKVLCEREAERQFPGRTLVLRPGSIVGPNDDRSPAHLYWPVRMQMGGEILVPGDPAAQVQMIDVRDLAEWAVVMAERAQTGTFNGTGPAMPMSWAEMLGGIRGSLAVPLKLTWVATQWLIERKVPGQDQLLFWPTEAGVAGSMQMSNDRARARGLTFRPWSTTVADILAWYDMQSPRRRRKLISTPGDLTDFMTLEREILAAWHAQRK